MISFEAIKSMFQDPNQTFEANLLSRKRLCNLEIRIMMAKKNGNCLLTSSSHSVVANHCTKSSTSRRSILLFTESDIQVVLPETKIQELSFHLLVQFQKSMFVMFWLVPGFYRPSVSI